MDPKSLRELLERVRDGRASIEQGIDELRDLPFRSLGFAHADTHRHLRTGFPEVIFAPGKTPEHIARILTELGRGGVTVMASRVTPEQAVAVKTLVPDVRHLEVPRMLVLGPEPPRDRGRGTVLVLSAGTSDIPVAEEAAVTAELDGNQVTRIYDVGVAGLHRLLARRAEVEAAEVVIAVAGMDGVLPTVTAGLFSRPVIAVPTSVGYGAALGGLGALTTMLNACASGVVVVNIDNGFGAGRAASLFNRKSRTAASSAEPTGGYVA